MKALIFDGAQNGKTGLDPIRSLVEEEVAAPIGRGELLPEDVEEAVAQQMYPSWIPGVFGGMGWRHQARKKGKYGLMKDRPYE